MGYLKTTNRGFFQDQKIRRYTHSVLCASMFAPAVVFGIPPLDQLTEDERRGWEITLEDERRDNGFDDLTADVRMILKSSNGRKSERTLRVETLEIDSDGDKTRMVFDAPRDVRGTAMLTYSHKEGADDQWLYLPALKRVKRISSANKTGAFLGSEFTYEDLASPEPEKFSYKYLRDEVYEGKDCFVLERYPVDKNSGYSKHVKWVDKQEYRPIRVDYYDRKGEHVKTMHLRNYKKYIDRIWRAGEMHMVNHKDNKETLLVWENYTFRNGLNENDFSQVALKRAR